MVLERGTGGEGGGRRWRKRTSCAARCPRFGQTFGQTQSGRDATPTRDERDRLEGLDRSAGGPAVRAVEQDADGPPGPESDGVIGLGRQGEPVEARRPAARRLDEESEPARRRR